MNFRVEERKERYSKEKQFSLFYCYSFRTSQIVVALRTTKPQLLVALSGHFLIATGDRAAAKF